MTMTTNAARLRGALLLACVAVLLSACANTAKSPKDPYEGFNRAMFEVNEVVDTAVAKPLAKAYDRTVPLPVKAGFGNFFDNVGDAWIGVNNGLQGKFSDAGIDFGRLLLNSTVGIFGLFDVASEIGMEKHEEDFGQTLARWGVGDGGYLFLPVFGPRTIRDGVGLVFDHYADPLGYIERIPTRNSASFVRFADIRASLLPADRVVEEAAIDKYTYIRDAYFQRRINQIYDGHPPKRED